MVADLIFRRGTVLTAAADSAHHSAAAVQGGRIVRVGTDRDVMVLAGSNTRVVDLAGGTLMPGINDSHLHLQWYAAARSRLDLSGAATLEDIRRLVHSHAVGLEPHAWILGRGWRDDQLSGAQPLAHLLDDVSMGHPAYLEHASAHGAWLNTEALNRARLDATTATPPGGGIARDKHGTPSGLLTEAALAMASEALPTMTAHDRKLATIAAVRHLNRLGVTSITDPLVTPDMLRDYVELRRQGLVSARLTVLLHWTWPSVTTPISVLETATNFVGTTTGFGDDYLRIGGCKLFADGVPTLGTAWMSSAYPDGSCGELVTEGSSEAARLAALTKSIELLHKHRFQVQVHATGDRACAATIDAFAAAMLQDPWLTARHVLIHANLLEPDLMAVMAHWGFVANTNSLIRHMAGPRLAEQLTARDWARTMPVRSLLDAGVVVADSSDAPITEPDWRRAVQLLMTREGSAHMSVPDQSLSLAQAVRAWTWAPAYQDGTETWKGTIEVGKAADLVVLEEDLRSIAADRIGTVTPVMTLVDGRVVHGD